jgi:hypothetical protein
MRKEREKMIQEIELKIVDDLLGFEHEGFFITEPNSSECGRFEVDPIKEYGLTKKQFDMIMNFNKTHDLS